MTTTWKIKGYNTKTGKRSTLTIEAETSQEAIDKARRQGITGAQLTTESGVLQRLASINYQPAPSRKDISRTLRSISTATDANMNFLESIQMAREGVKKNSSMHRTLIDIEQSIRAGKPPEEAMAAHPKAFNEPTIAAIEAGHSSGDLSGTLNLLAEAEESASNIRSKIRGALVYPAFVLAVTIGALVFALTNIVPQMAENLAEIGGELPAITKVAVTGSDFITANIKMMILVTGVLLVATVATLRTPQAKQKLAWLSWRLPIMGKVVQATNEGTFCAITGVLMSATISPEIAFDISSKTVRNLYYKQTTAKIVRLMKEESYTTQESIERNTPPLSRMIKILADQSASGLEDPGLPWTRYAKIRITDANQRASNLSSAIKPLLTLVVGGGVLFFVLVVYSPMLEVIKTLT